MPSPPVHSEESLCATAATALPSDVGVNGRLLTNLRAGASNRYPYRPATVLLGQCRQASAAAPDPKTIVTGAIAGYGGRRNGRWRNEQGPRLPKQ